MKAKLLIASTLIALTTGCSTFEKAPLVVEKEALYNHEHLGYMAGQLEIHHPYV
jgi:hypothetical protein